MQQFVSDDAALEMNIDEQSIGALYNKPLENGKQDSDSIRPRSTMIL